MTAHGLVHWNELNTHDSQAARDFYGTTLGWTFEPMDMPDGSKYWLIRSGDAMVGGIFEMVHPAFDGIPEHWFTHFAVDDLDARLEKARQAGATITREPFDVPGVGRLAVLQAASGSYCAWIQPQEAVEAGTDGNP
ncbi:MAG: VOC family protein [Roseitalea sp.]|jgi:predicted enzyme related to lactoylglutathione lyase|nr:VOC family protein [Roseitalea sp.]MBO6722035.1 VOC family protein [Roseitalea sp.]MBO6743473.1 VOC family protein [Roseitalea sp.]